MTQLEVSIRFEVISCYMCGAPFGITESFAAARRRDGRTFCCPSEHPQSFTSDNKLQKLEMETTSLRDKLDRERKHNEQLQLRVRALTGRVVKLHTRLLVTCEACGRKVTDLKAHVRRRHKKS